MEDETMEGSGGDGGRRHVGNTGTNVQVLERMRGGERSPERRT